MATEQEAMDQWEQDRLEALNEYFGPEISFATVEEALAWAEENESEVSALDIDEILLHGEVRENQSATSVAADMAMLGIPLLRGGRIAARVAQVLGRSNAAKGVTRASVGLADDLATHTIAQLRAAARTAGIAIPSKLKKADIIALLNNAIPIPRTAAAVAGSVATAPLRAAGAVLGAAWKGTKGWGRWLKGPDGQTYPNLRRIGRTGLSLGVGNTAFQFGAKAVGGLLGMVGIGDDETQGDTLTADESSANADEVAAQITQNYYTDQRGAEDATLNYVRWVLDHTAWVPGQGAEGLTTESLTDPRFREQWVQHHVGNWQGNAEIEQKMIDTAFKSFPDVAATIEEQFGVSVDDTSAWLTKFEATGRIPLNTLAQQAVDEWTTGMVEQGSRIVMVGESIAPVSEGSGRITDYFLSSTGRPEDVVNDVFDLFSNGRVSPENAEAQLEYLYSYSPELFDTLARELYVLGMYPEGYAPTPGVSGPDEETLEAYKTVQIKLVDMNRDSMSAGDGLLDSQEMKQALVQDRIASFRQLRTGRENVLSENLIRDMTSNIAGELEGRGWVTSQYSTGNMMGEIEAAVRNSVTEDASDRPAGTFRERELANLILEDYWGQDINEDGVVGTGRAFGPTDSDASALTSAARRGHLPTEVEDEILAGTISLNAARKAAGEDSFKNTAVNDLITYMGVDESLAGGVSSEAMLFDALQMYSVAHGGSHNFNFSPDELSEIVSNAYATSASYGIGEEQETSERGVLAGLGREDMGNPAMVSALAEINNALGQRRGVERSRFRNV